MPATKEFFEIQQQLVDFRRAVLAGNDPTPEELAEAISKYRAAREHLKSGKKKTDAKDGD